MSTFYFDGHSAVSDPNTVWSTDSNAFDGNTSTAATCGTAGSVSTNFLLGEGTNATGSGAIFRVDARVFSTVSGEKNTNAAIYTDGLGELLGTATRSNAASGWGSYVTLTAPASGWTWLALAELEVKLYATSITAGNAYPSRVELEVFLLSETIPGGFYMRQGWQ